MEFHLVPILLFLSMAFVVSHAALPSEKYWNSMLPNTRMPQAVKDLLRPEWQEDRSTSVEVGKGGVNVDAGNGKQGSGTKVNVGKGGVNVNKGKGKEDSGTNVNVGRKGVGVNTGKTEGQGASVGVGKGGVIVKTGPKQKLVYVSVRPWKDNFVYRYAATDDQLLDNPNVALFFLEKDLHKGTKMNLHFTKSANPATFLPRQVVKSIPFSSNKLFEIFNQFSVKSNSKEAEVIKQTIKECEEPGIEGEEKYCATSLESMVDFSTSKLGKNVDVISTTVEKETQMQTYSIEKVKEMKDDKVVICHKQNYVYAVFYCHKTRTTKAYNVFLVGANGTKANAVAVCHKDTAAWNPKHLAFKVLKVKPGTIPVCHFLPEDHIVWVSN